MAGTAGYVFFFTTFHFLEKKHPGTPLYPRPYRPYKMHGVGNTILYEKCMDGVGKTISYEKCGLQRGAGTPFYKIFKITIFRYLI